MSTWYHSKQALKPVSILTSFPETPDTAAPFYDDSSASEAAGFGAVGA
jgi:hypothetical protein